MNRKYFRLVSVAAVLFALNLAMLPTADAQGLSGSRATVHTGTDGFGAVLAWMAELLHLGPTNHSSGLSHQSSAFTLGGTTTGGPLYTPNTGPCIDPNGGSCTK